MTSNLLILLITNCMVSKWPKLLWITVLLLHLSWYWIVFWATLHLPVGFKIACFSVVCFDWFHFLICSECEYLPKHLPQKLLFLLNPLICSYHCYSLFVSHVCLNWALQALCFSVESTGQSSLLYFLPLSSCILYWLRKFYIDHYSKSSPVCYFSKYIV